MVGNIREALSATKAVAAPIPQWLPRLLHAMASAHGDRNGEKDPRVSRNPGGFRL